MAKRDSKWKRNLISAFIIMIMVLSVLGIMLSRDAGQTKKYNGHKFTAKDNKWLLNVDKWLVDFDYLPTGVEDISISQEIKNKILNTKMIYLTFDPENATKTMDKLRFDLINLLANKFGIHAAGSITRNSTKYQLPVMTCKNATVYVPVVELKLGNQTNIYIKDNCIIAQAESAEDITRIGDALIYKLTGVV